MPQQNDDKRLGLNPGLAGEWERAGDSHEHRVGGRALRPASQRRRGGGSSNSGRVSGSLTSGRQSWHWWQDSQWQLAPSIRCRRSTGVACSSRRSRGKETGRGLDRKLGKWDNDEARRTGHK
jgi:hypothetical protein